MTVKRALVTALLAIAALPATAAAQTPIMPPEGDNYLASIVINDESTPFPKSEIGFVADTTNYTTQADLASPAGDGSPGGGGPPESAICPAANTIWSIFYSNRYGRMDISTAGPFDSVIGIVGFNNLSDATPRSSLPCVDRLAGFQEETRFLVSPKKWYAVQVGGTGSPAGGQVQVKFHLIKPPSVDGQAFLFWKLQPLRVSALYVKNVPKGQKITLSCTKHACRKKTVSVKSKPGAEFFSGKIADTPSGVRMKGGPSGGAATSADTWLRPIVREAQHQVSVLKNQKVKRGAKIELRITRPGYIGKYYVWSVSSTSVSSAKTLCLNPGSSKPRKKCTG
jgi:hypothetical protein